MKAISIIIHLLVFGSSMAQKNALVRRVKDGDTFVAVWNGKVYNCRLLNVDAPELKQAYGVEARDSISNLILGKTVRLDSIKLDLYGRVLVDVWVGGQRLDSLAVCNGWAWHYAQYSKSEGLKDSMELACAKGLGLWRCGKSMACPPWLYRKFHYRERLRYCSGC
jgi:endonuclease YncB( thermonuclease family)